MSKNCSSDDEAEGSNGREFVSKTDIGYWLQRLYRNSYTHKGKTVAVKGWSVKIQRNGRRKSFSLAASNREDAAGEALRIYKTIVAAGWDAVKQRGSGSSPEMSVASDDKNGKAPMGRLDSEHWRRKLVKRPYPAFLPESERQFAIYLEHAGVGRYFPLETNVASDAANQAAQIDKMVREQGWEIAGQTYSRELALAIRWLDNPVAWTYATLYTQPAIAISNGHGSHSEKRKVAIVEPEPGLQKSFASYVSSQEGFWCCHVCTTVEEMLRAIRRQPVDLVLVNSCFREVSDAAKISPEENLITIGGTHLLPESATKIAVVCVFYSVFEDADHLFKHAPGGAIGYMLKRTPPNRLLEPIAAVTGSLTHKQASAKIRKYFQNVIHSMPSGAAMEGLVKLTPREREILSQLAKGRVTKEIASALEISSWTVNGHVKSIFSKLNVHTRTEAVVRFLEPIS